MDQNEIFGDRVMRCRAFVVSLGRAANALVPSRASLRGLVLPLAVGFGFGIAGQIAGSVLPSMFGASWPSWGGSACSFGAPVLAAVTILTWSVIRDRNLWLRR